MKKIYVRPQVKITAIQAEALLANSGINLSDSEKDDGNGNDWGAKELDDEMADAQPAQWGSLW